MKENERKIPRSREKGNERERKLVRKRESWEWKEGGKVHEQMFDIYV